MSLKQRLQRQLANAREVSERLLEALQTPAEWTKQVHQQSNHALWFAGHMGITDNFLISMVAPEKTAEKEGYAELFGMGSQPTGNAADYPPVAEVLDHMQERRRVLLDI